VEASQFI